MTLARRLGLGRLVYRYLYRPIGEWGTDNSRMARAATRLTAPALPFLAETWPPCRYLTGSEFWYQTVFCARSLELACGTLLRFEFFDDGTLTHRESKLLQRLFSRSRVVAAADSEGWADTMLPGSRFPLLRAARQAHPLMRKLIDLHLPTSRYSVCLDSDMLFFAVATELRYWLEQPTINLHLCDIVESYAAPRAQLEATTGKPLLPMVNTGIVAQDDGRVDWEFFEWYVARLDPALRTHRLLEQTLMAAHHAHVGGQPLPPESYRVLINDFETAPPATLLHYCWNSNSRYRQSEWRRFRNGLYREATRGNNFFAGLFGS